ncbi:uncharacterized protein C8R40DRAFT_130378 [Lentinula edodes]|uniref:uncharacterized protein n=1 Tax=Lentinula edodes TaxID=5353 RepID=UPI001E8EDD43|nr:uncharacterized protein C8R40DRAFT_130378 [Lentinula edodes]KAH7876358.1 hypothetical protein C8R40DRAFT_130378 [Lentinula edodes]
MEEETLAYVLDQSTGFRYDLLLGRTFLAKHDVQFNWQEHTLELVDLCTRGVVKVQACRCPNDPEETQELYSLKVTDSNTANISELNDDDNGDSNDQELPSPPSTPIPTSTVTTTVSNKEDADTELKKGSFGDKLRTLAMKMFPKCFREKPIRIRGRPHSPRENLEIKNFLENGIRDGVIERSDSPWSAPILLIPKKDGTLRPCVDLRALNNLT